MAEGMRMDVVETPGGLIRALPWILFALFVIAWAGGLYWDRSSEEVTSTSDWVWAASFIAFPVVGVFLARRFPRNAIGWLFLAGPTLVGMGITVGEYSEAVGAPAIGEIGGSLFGLGLIVLGSALLLFPDGRYPRRWFIWVHIGLVAVLLVANSEDVDGVAMVGLLVLTVGGLIWRVVEGDGATRRQMTPPLLVGLTGLLVLIVMDWLFPTLENDWAGVLAFMLITVGIPVAIGVSVTKYRLYDIDRIVSRTVTYTLVAILLAGAVALVAAIVGTRFESPLVVAATTLGVAATFNPLRRRVQTAVDRRFNRSRYDAERVMDEFALTLRDRVESDRLIGGWVGVVSETMQPSLVGVWVRQ